MTARVRTRLNSINQTWEDEHVMTKSQQNKAPADLREHIERLREKGLLTVIDTPINKDTHLHPLVRWQFQGGLADSARRAFLFTNVHGADGRQFDTSVIVGALAASPEIYATGMGVAVEDIGEVWTKGISAPIQPIKIENPPCQEVVIQGDDLRKPGGGLSTLPIPISRGPEGERSPVRAYGDSTHWRWRLSALAEIQGAWSADAHRHRRWGCSHRSIYRPAKAGHGRG